MPSRFASPAAMILLMSFLMSWPVVVGGSTRTLRDVDRIRIAEGFRLADSLGNKLWPGWDGAPFAVLLVTAEQEFLIRHPKPSDDFTLVGDDSVLGARVWRRPRQFPTHLLATFPAVGGVSTVVIGQAESTAARTSTRWVVTLLHEHFHQLQDSQPGYYDAVDSLDLARGDKTGMWMLNYPFPYAEPKVRDGFSAMCRRLSQTLDVRARPDFDEKFTTYVEARKTFQSLLEEDDYRYFAFQVWREGIARYTEYRLAEVGGTSYKPSAAFVKLADYRPFEAVAQELLKAMERELASPQMDKNGRTVVYNFGLAEGLVLDRREPEWRSHYFKEKFSLDRRFAPNP